MFDSSHFNGPNAALYTAEYESGGRWARGQPGPPTCRSGAPQRCLPSRRRCGWWRPQRARARAQDRVRVRVHRRHPPLQLRQAAGAEAPTPLAAATVRETSARRVRAQGRGRALPSTGLRGNAVPTGCAAPTRAAAAAAHERRAQPLRAAAWARGFRVAWSPDGGTTRARRMLRGCAAAWRGRGRVPRWRMSRHARARMHHVFVTRLWGWHSHY